YVGSDHRSAQRRVRPKEVQMRIRPPNSQPPGSFGRVRFHPSTPLVADDPSAFELRPSFDPRPSTLGLPLTRAFSLIEVMIACGIFFMATFAILALVSTTLRNARALQRGDVDA